MYGEGFYPQLHRCWVTAAQKATQRRYDRLHADEQPDEYDQLPTDGTSVWMSTEDLTPDDDFLDEHRGEPEREGGPPDPRYQPE